MSDSGDGGAGLDATQPIKHHPKAINCPNCGVYTSLTFQSVGTISAPIWNGYAVESTVCVGCAYPMIWLNGQLVYPLGLVGPAPSSGMSDSVREVYEESRAIAASSPRAAAALLRVAVEMLIKEIDHDSGTLFDKIGRLVERGLDKRIQKMLDSVRVFGNDGAHASQINLKEQPGTVEMLMFCVNQIAEQMVTIPGRIDEFYGTLPQDKRDAIERRDQKPVEHKV